MTIKLERDNTKKMHEDWKVGDWLLCLAGGRNSEKAHQSKYKSVSKLRPILKSYTGTNTRQTSDSYRYTSKKAEKILEKRLKRGFPKKCGGFAPVLNLRASCPWRCPVTLKICRKWQQTEISPASTEFSVVGDSVLTQAVVGQS